MVQQISEINDLTIRSYDCLDNDSTRLETETVSFETETSRVSQIASIGGLYVNYVSSPTILATSTLLINNLCSAMPRPMHTHGYDNIVAIGLKTARNRSASPIKGSAGC